MITRNWLKSTKPIKSIKSIKSVTSMKCILKSRSPYECQHYPASTWLLIDINYISIISGRLWKFIGEKIGKIRTGFFRKNSLSWILLEDSSEDSLWRIFSKIPYILLLLLLGRQIYQVIRFDWMDDSQGILEGCLASSCLSRLAGCLHSSVLLGFFVIWCFFFYFGHVFV